MSKKASSKRLPHHKFPNKSRMKSNRPRERSQQCCEWEREFSANCIFKWQLHLYGFKLHFNASRYFEKKSLKLVASSSGIIELGIAVAASISCQSRLSAIPVRSNAIYYALCPLRTSPNQMFLRKEILSIIFFLLHARRSIGASLLTATKSECITVRLMCFALTWLVAYFPTKELG